MSIVYEALKKAALEGRAQPDDQEVAQAATESVQHNGLNATLDAGFHQASTDGLSAPIIEPAGRPEIVVGDAASGRISDEFQVLATHFRRLAEAQNGHVIQITSTVAKEGKSFIALNLAMSLARIGCCVTLVDADLRAPSLHKAFSLMPLNGMLGYLLQRASFEICNYRTPISGLMLIPAGGSSSSGGELFAGSRMREFLAAVTGAYPNGYVLVDSPPLLGAPEAQIISRTVDAILMVVAANQTPRTAVGRALDLIKGCNMLGLVLNRFEPSYSHRVQYRY
jgi:protein-tyrosine kinase